MKYSFVLLFVLLAANLTIQGQSGKTTFYPFEVELDIFTGEIY
jgi:hypothetical protein